MQNPIKVDNLEYRRVDSIFDLCTMKFINARFTEQSSKRSKLWTTLETMKSP